jgi:deoxyribonuclease-4
MHIHYIGAHIKKESGTLLKTIHNIQKNGGNALQLFVSNPRSAQLPNLQVYKNMSDEIREYCKLKDFKLVIHSSYTINLSKEPKLGKKILDLKDCYWINLLLHELIVADIIGAVGVVVHVGKYTKNTQEQGLYYMKNAIQYILQELNKMGLNAKLMIETPAGAGTELLTTVEDFALFYNDFSKEEKKNLGICVDTAHIWSSGYNIAEYYNELAKHNAKDILVVHFNNSKKEKGSKADIHDSLFGKDGKIAIKELQYFLNILKYNPILDKKYLSLTKNYIEIWIVVWTWIDER